MPDPSMKKQTMTDGKYCASIAHGVVITSSVGLELMKWAKIVLPIEALLSSDFTLEVEAEGYCEPNAVYQENTANHPESAGITCRPPVTLSQPEGKGKPPSFFLPLSTIADKKQYNTALSLGTPLVGRGRCNTSVVRHCTRIMQDF